MKSVFNKLASLLLFAASGLSGIAHAVNDLPGGPAVRQLNLHPAVTRIGVEQAWVVNCKCTVFIAYLCLKIP